MSSTLFASEPNVNLLPYDGEAYYPGTIFNTAEAERWFNILSKDIAWKPDEVSIFGKRIITKREVAWYTDPGLAYTYSGSTKPGLPWTESLLGLKSIVDTRCGCVFNSCLLNLYHDGSEGMSWHSDNERSIVKHSPIASLSFGAERKFSFKHKKDGRSQSLILENGSFLLMKGAVQEHWLHRLPKSVKIKSPRINLTFRQMLAQDIK